MNVVTARFLRTVNTIINGNVLPIFEEYENLYVFILNMIIQAKFVTFVMSKFVTYDLSGRRLLILPQFYKWFMNDNHADNNDVSELFANSAYFK